MSKLKYAIATDGPNGIILKGKAPSQVDPDFVTLSTKPLIYDDSTCNGMRVAMRVRAVLKGGVASSDLLVMVLFP